MQTFEKLNQNFGFVLYQTTVTEAAGTYILQVPGLHGRGLVYAEGYYQGTITREVEQNSLPVNIYGSVREVGHSHLCAR
jgi:beta-galactosidase